MTRSATSSRQSILTRPKAGFPVPFGSWLQAGWHAVARDVLLDRRARERDIVAPAPSSGLVEAAARGVHGSAEVVWSLVNLELWFRTFIDGEGVQTLPLAACRPPAAARPIRSSSRPRPPATQLMRILWLNANLLLPLDKGGKIRTWHLMRHLARRHEITYLTFANDAEAEAHRPAMREVCRELVNVPWQDARQGQPALLRRRRRAPRRSAALRGRQVPIGGVSALARGAARASAASIASSATSWCRR